MNKELKFIQQICMLNFIELQEIRKHLNIATDMQSHDFPQSVSQNLDDMRKKLAELIRQLPVELQ